MTGEGLEILLVEDSPDDAELTLLTLRKEKLANRVQVARDGQEALDFLFCKGEFSSRSFEDAPKLILLDLKLPKVSGLEVLQILKNDPRTKNIPVVVLTSSQEDRDIADAYTFRANGYVQKPVAFEQFRTAVTNIGYYWLLTNKAPALVNFATATAGTSKP